MSQHDPETLGLPPICYIRHPTSGETVAILRNEDGYRSPQTLCSPMPQREAFAPPTEAQINAMKHGSLMGWATPGADPAFWERMRDADRR